MSRVPAPPMQIRHFVSIAAKCALASAFLITCAIAQTARPRATTENNRIADLKGEWIGTLDQRSQDLIGTFPVKLTINGINGDEFTGSMDWPTFNDCKTEVRGAIDGSTIKWTETAYLKGDDVVLNGLYVARFVTKGEITGEWMDPQYSIFPKGPNYGVPGATIALKKKRGSRTP